LMRVTFLADMEGSSGRYCSSLSAIGWNRTYNAQSNNTKTHQTLAT